MEQSPDSHILNDNLFLTERSALSSEVLDSTLNAEQNVSNVYLGEPTSSSTFESSSLGSPNNFALTATVSAESTYPGYSIDKINDGDVNTTVGPNYSWTNNFPAGATLPESVFLKFYSATSIRRIDIFTSTGYELRDYTIQYRATKGGAWVTLLSVDDNTQVYNSHVFNEVSALEVGIICELGPNNQYIYGRLNEVEIYGPQGPTLPMINVSNGMLEFSNEADLVQTIEYLEYIYDQYNESFYSQHTGLTDEELFDLEYQIGFNDQQPFIDFENNYGINSLRAKLLAEEEVWLSTMAGDSTAGNNPDDEFAMFGYEMRTLINDLGEIKVNNQIYTFFTDGSYTVNQQGGGSLQDPELENPTLVNLNSTNFFASPICKNWDREAEPEYNGNWRIKKRTAFYNGPFDGAAKFKALTISYRKRFGRWWRASSTLYVEMFGFITNSSDCSLDIPAEAIAVTKRGRSVKTKNYCVNCKVKKNKLASVHWSSKVPTYYVQYLTW